jgi:aconitase B
MYYSKPSKPGEEIAPIRFTVINEDDNGPESIPIQEAEEGEIIENEPYQGVYESDSNEEEDNESESEHDEPNFFPP